MEMYKIQMVNVDIIHVGDLWGLASGMTFSWFTKRPKTDPRTIADIAHLSIQKTRRGKQNVGLKMGVFFSEGFSEGLKPFIFLSCAFPFFHMVSQVYSCGGGGFQDLSREVQPPRAVH